MKLKRKHFSSPDNQLDLYNKVSLFVDGLGERFVSISEYCTSYTSKGDSWVINFAVFYWSEDK